MLKKYHPVWLNTHFNTPKEFTPEAAKACAMLADSGIPLGNQSVLLAGIIMGLASAGLLGALSGLFAV